MKLPQVQPLEENHLCKNKSDFVELAKTTLSKACGGAFFKVFGKVSGKPYYITLIVDREKILAAEVQDISGGSQLIGKPAVDLLTEMLESGPVIVDSYPLSDVELKLSIVDNIDVYNSTPKLTIAEVCSDFSSAQDTIPKSIEEKIQVAEKILQEGLEKPKPKKSKKTQLKLEVPTELDPYFRALANKITKYAKSMGVSITSVRINAREVRYALGAGTGIHTTVELRGKSESQLSPKRIKQLLEEFTYREAGELSSEIGKRVVISNVSAKLD